MFCLQIVSIEHVVIWASHDLFDDCDRDWFKRQLY